MNSRLFNLLWKIFWSVLLLVFVNNPQSPFSIPVFWHETFYWAPIFRADYVSFYQIVFSIFLLGEMLVAVFEYVSPMMSKYCDLTGELIDLARLVIIRDIPKAAVNLSASTLDRIYPIAFWIINLIIFFTVIGIIIHAIRLTRWPKSKIPKHKIIKPK